MPDEIVLDASVLASISFFQDILSERAADAIADVDLITVDIAIAEVGNVAWKRVVHFQEDSELTLIALEKCIAFIMEACNVINARDLVGDAYSIAVEHKVSFYDSLYIAAAKKERAPFLTLDKKLFEKMKDVIDIRLV
jgi:predicted nucleic acid-binding protein